MILGDLFEVWVGDDAMQGEFESRCAQVLQACAERCSVAFMAGNRDFLVGERMLGDCGVRGLEDPSVLVAQGTRLLLTHGDALCVGDEEYQQFRRLVRGASWQREFLALELPLRRERAQQIRTQSKERQRLQSSGEWFDVDAATAVQWLQAAGATTMIHGHTHRPGSGLLAPGYMRHVLSDWELDHGNPPRAEVLRLQGAKLTRLPAPLP
ncbi:MAG: UDP-2,3-diacylglucosamine diphosphatase [Rhizobacter sp.]|nr:UDP-2,3-diacylglucosamine diphosphatase [Rhizobacter sp.]